MGTHSFLHSIKLGEGERTKYCLSCGSDQICAALNYFLDLGLRIHVGNTFSKHSAQIESTCLLPGLMSNMCFTDVTTGAQ